MKKKIWSLLLVMCLILAVVGCKKGQEEEDDDKDEKVKATQELKNEDDKGNKKDDSENQPDSKGDVQTPGITVAPKEDGSYVASYLLDNAKKNDVALKAQGGLTVDASVSFKGELLDMFASELSAAMGEEVKKQFDVGLQFDVDYAENNSGLMATISLNGQKISLDAFLKDTIAYIGAPELSSTYIKVDLTEALEEVMSLFASQELTQNQEKYTKLVEELAKNIAACVTAERVEENAVVAVKNTELGIDTKVTGTKRIDKVDVTKLLNVLGDFIKDVSGDDSMSVPATDAEAGEVFVLTNEAGDVVFGLTAEEEEIFVLNNKDFMTVAKNESGEESDVLLFAKKDTEKTGRIFLTPDGEIVDDFELSYELINDGIKITLMGEVDEKIVSITFTVIKGGIGAEASVLDDGGEMFKISLNMKERAYKAHNTNVTTVDDPMEWVSTLSQDKLMKFITDAFGVSAEAFNNLAGAAGGNIKVPGGDAPITDPSVIGSRYDGKDEYQKILYSLPEFQLAMEAESPNREDNLGKMVMFEVSEDSIKKYGLKDTSGDAFVSGNKTLVDKICKIAKDATKEEAEYEKYYEVFGSFGSDLTCFLKNIELYQVPTKDYTGLEITITKVGDDSLYGVKLSNYLAELTDDDVAVKTANEMLKALGCSQQLTKEDISKDGFAFRSGKLYVFTSFYECDWNEEKPYRLSIEISKNIFE